MEKISAAIENLQDIDNTDIIFSTLEDIREAFKVVNFNIDKLNQLKVEIKKIQVQLDLTLNDDIFSTIDNLNINYQRQEKMITENNNLITNFLKKYINFCDFNLPNSTSLVQNNDVNYWKVVEDEHKDEKTTKKITKETQEHNGTPIKTLTDNNTLLISEKENTVFLPYLISDVKNIFEKNKNKYTDLQDVIAKNYIFPLSKFKNPVLSRFKEAFALMKNKEKASMVQCLDLALELAFISLLNPAIISACKNLDELDIYLDCLDNNELDKFTIFEIIYEIAPSKI